MGIIFYHQKEDAFENGELRDSNNDPELILTTGENERIKSKAIYFVRLIPNGEACNTAGSGNEIIYGEINPETMSCLERLLNDVFLPQITHLKEEEGWEKCDEEHRTEYKSVMNRFVKELDEAMKSLQGVVYLKNPDPKWDLHKIQESDHTAL